MSVAVGGLQRRRQARPRRRQLQLDDTVSVLLNTTPTGATTASFAAQQTFATGTEPHSVAVADFNGDGKPDLVVANDGVRDTVSVLLNTTPAGATTASFAAQQTFAHRHLVPDSVAVGGLQRRRQARPRRRQLRVKYSGNTVSVLLNTTAAGATTPLLRRPADLRHVGSIPRSVAVADFNGDGKPDLIVANCERQHGVGAAEHDGGRGRDLPRRRGRFSGQGVEELDRTAGAWANSTSLTPPTCRSWPPTPRATCSPTIRATASTATRPPPSPGRWSTATTPWR